MFIYDWMYFYGHIPEYRGRMSVLTVVFVVCVRYIEYNCSNVYGKWSLAQKFFYHNSSSNETLTEISNNSSERIFNS